MQDESSKQRSLARLKRVAGQVAGIQRMIEEDRYCVDVIQQISAARAALAKVSQIMLAQHMETCVKHAFMSRDDDDRQAKIDELVAVFEKATK